MALKILRKESLGDERAIARFERKCRPPERLTIRPWCGRWIREVGGVRLLAMEFVEGYDLGTLIARCNPLSVADACELARQGALGLQCIHNHKLVHRDVKPSNLMLNRQGQVKLLDLGLAKFEAGQAEQEVTAAEHAVGTIEYMAPECFGGKGVSIFDDVYALGCTLFKLLTGRTPFSGVKGAAAMMAAACAASAASARPDSPRRFAGAGPSSRTNACQVPRQAICLARRGGGGAQAVLRGQRFAASAGPCRGIFLAFRDAARRNATTSRHRHHGD